MKIPTTLDLFKGYTIFGDGALVPNRYGSIDITIYLFYTNKRNITIYFVGSLSDFHIFKGYCASLGFIGNYKHFLTLSDLSSMYTYRHFFSTPSYIEEYLSSINT